MPPAGSNHMPNMNVSSRPLRQPSRRKIEYVPFAREYDTAGGRDLKAINEEMAKSAKRPHRDLPEWGAVDVEALMLSLRSRLSIELSYALTTITLISLIRGTGAGYVVSSAPDLFEEALRAFVNAAPHWSAPLDCHYRLGCTSRPSLCCRVLRMPGATAFSRL